MKNIFTRFLGLPLFACALAISLMAACGGSSSTTTTDEVDAEAAADNNASRALDTTALTITTTVPAN